MIATRKHGIDTIVEEDGRNLSGGEIQRIGIARSHGRNVDLIMLDEITSNLDDTTAIEMENVICSLSDVGVISVTDTRNPAILRLYDEILMMEDGKIIRSGHYDKLQEFL